MQVKTYVEKHQSGQSTSAVYISYTEDELITVQDELISALPLSTHSAVEMLHDSALPLSTHSAVEMLHDSALYQFMIDMTLSFENSQTVNCNKIQNFGHFVELEIRVATKDKDYMQLKLLSTDLPLC